MLSFLPSPAAAATTAAAGVGSMPQDQLSVFWEMGCLFLFLFVCLHWPGKPFLSKRLSAGKVKNFV